MLNKLTVVAFAAALTATAQTKPTTTTPAPPPRPAQKAGSVHTYAPTTRRVVAPSGKRHWWTGADALFADEPEAQPRPGWFPTHFLGLPLGRVVDEGSRGIDEFYRKETVGVPGEVTHSSTADAWFDQVALHNKLMGPPPEPEPQIAPWEVVSSEGRLADSNGSVGHYQWRIVVRNNTDTELVLSGDVDLVDADGHAVDGSKVAALRIPAHGEQEVSGAKMVMSDSAQSISGPRVSLH